MSTAALQPPLVEDLYRTLEEKVRTLRPRDDLSSLSRAYQYALKMHGDQKRKSGEPYITHPIRVALILAEMQMDMVCLQTGLLHDILEDTPAVMTDLRDRFGEDVARCVDGVTKLSKISFREPGGPASGEPAQNAAGDDERTSGSLSSSWRTGFTTCGRSARYRTKSRQDAIAQETIDIYAPIAHRLGMGKVRGELEDLAFQDAAAGSGGGPDARDRP